jgi:general secretion pathway protein E
VPGYLIKSTLLGVVAQRLLRKLCPHCRRAEPIDPALWKEITAGWPMPAPTRVNVPVGCLECRETGYLGRVGIYEMMPLASALHPLIHDHADLMELREAAVREGLTPLRIAGCHKIAAGVTSIDEVLGVAPPPPPRTAAS